MSSDELQRIVDLGLSELTLERRSQATVTHGRFHKTAQVGSQTVTVAMTPDSSSLLQLA